MSEIYLGTKFQSVQISNKAPEHKKLKMLNFWCSYFNNSNLAPPYEGGSSGNLSFRCENEKFIITAEHTALSDDMQNSDFVKVTKSDIKNFKLEYEGKKLPSSESLMHYAIYENRPEINAIFHGHSPEILKYAEHFNFPVTKIEEEYGTAKLIDEMLKILKDNNFIILKNHGFISLGKDIETAGKNVYIILEKINNIK